MAPTATLGSSPQLLVVGDEGGVTVVNPSTPLKRLNYFDGKLLRAGDFNVEQNYLRHLVALSNQGLGSGVVYGYDTTLGSGDTIEIGPGLAIDPSGTVLLLQAAMSQNIQALIEQSRRSTTPAATTAASAARASLSTANLGVFNDCVQIAAPPPTAVVPVSDIYVIAICAAEALCGQSDVFGKLCEEACVTATDRPYRLDGIVLRAIPLQLVTPFPTSHSVSIGGNLYLRSKVAHSWYADEVRKHPNAVSRNGLLSEVWCLGSSYDSGCCEVPLAVVARAGTTTIFLDPWIVRRERMDAPSRRYWQWTMRMRPWDVFLAQILQFQCQLADLLDGVATPGNRGNSPCQPQQEALQQASDLIQQVRSGLVSYRSAVGARIADQPAVLALSLTQVADLHEKLTRVIAAGQVVPAKDRILIRGGIVELPSAGYLPVINGSDVTVNDQVRALVGDGLDLRFCVTTADYIAHAVEEAQHLERISLLQGLDDPSNKPHVDILVPDGTLATSSTPKAGLFDATMAFSAEQTGGLIYRGAGREEVRASGGMALSMAAAGLSEKAIVKFQAMARAVTSTKATAKPWTVTPNVDSNVFITTPKTFGVRLDSLVANISSSARMFTSGDVNAATRKKLLASEGRITAAHGTVDGMWLTASSDLEWRTLGVDDHTPVTLRVVIGSRPASPIAFDLTFHGTLSISGVASGPVLTGTLNGIVAIGMLKESQADQQTTESLVTERFNWPVTITYADSGNGLTGTIALDLAIGRSTAPSGSDAGPEAGRSMHLRFLKTMSGPGAPIMYSLLVVTGATLTDTISVLGAANATAVTLGRLRLVPDADIVNPSNAFHQYAESALDIVQAALIVSEPNIEANAESILFPAQAAATRELTIDAVRDWVAFTRRREKHCAAVEPPPPPAPPRIYRVINLTAETLDAATSAADALAAALHDPAKVVTAIQALLLRQDRGDTVKLFVKFAGGTANADSDLANAESDWKTFNPGGTIVYAAIGAVGESDAALQLKRIATFETAISGDSHETPATKEDAIIPYPQAAAPANADGIMIFVTVAGQTITRHALLVYVNSDTVNGQRLHFLSPSANATFAQPPSPSSTMDFIDNAPQGTALSAFIASLNVTQQPVAGVTLATTRAAPDAGAQARLQAVINALKAANRPIPATSRQVVQALSDPDRAELNRVGHDPNTVDEAIFLEVG
jgi:hypothetical protein